jgi:hypothetical protein
MAHWNDVKERLREDFTLDVDQPTEVTLTVHRQGAKGPRAQRVMLRHYEAWGRSMIEVRSAFGELGAYDPASLLADNLQLPLGAVALHGKYLVLLHKACLADLTVDGVVFLLTQVSTLADVLEARSGTDRF